MTVSTAPTWASVTLTAGKLSTRAHLNSDLRKEMIDDLKQTDTLGELVDTESLGWSFRETFITDIVVSMEEADDSIGTSEELARIARDEIYAGPDAPKDVAISTVPGSAVPAVKAQCTGVQDGDKVVFVEYTLSFPAPSCTWTWGRTSTSLPRTSEPVPPSWTPSATPEHHTGVTTDCTMGARRWHGCARNRRLQDGAASAGLHQRAGRARRAAPMDQFWSALTVAAGWPRALHGSHVSRNPFARIVSAASVGLRASGKARYSSGTETSPRPSTAVISANSETVSSGGFAGGAPS